MIVIMRRHASFLENKANISLLAGDMHDCVYMCVVKHIILVNMSLCFLENKASILLVIIYEARYSCIQLSLNHVLLCIRFLKEQNV